ncbi:MAG: phosphate ABC transporter permease PstA, partial [Rhodospirillales bacterium]|nr:phosphate ABC transporter permease PstA [Rhodospirillales bacterium]
RYHAAEAEFNARIGPLQSQYEALSQEAGRIKAEDSAVQIVLADVSGETKSLSLSAIVRMYPANDLDLFGKLGVYLSRWWEFLSEEPREANTEGGIWPAIFGTAAMTLLLVVLVAPFGIITALYLREYARQGRLVSMVRISVNNLAGVPSIVYGVFGLGFFAYLLGGTIDQLFYAERLPNPTFGTGGLLWASLTLALLTVPVVIVATEEALAAVPRSMREGALACGASKWQTIRTIVLPRALPGILTGVILAMARGAGEVAPLMLVGVVKLAPELPVDGVFPFIHLERSFMHLGFHIYDVGFQSRNSEAGKPMVFMTTLLLILLIFVMNIAAILIRNRLKRRFAGGQF